MILPKSCKKLGKIYVRCLGNFLSYIILPKSCMKLGKILAWLNIAKTSCHMLARSCKIMQVIFAREVLQEQKHEAPLGQSVLFLSLPMWASLEDQHGQPWDWSGQHGHPWAGQHGHPWAGQHGQPCWSVWASLGWPVSPWTNQIPRHVHIKSLLFYFILQARPHPKQKKKMNSMIELTSPKWPVHELHRNIGRALKKLVGVAEVAYTNQVLQEHKHEAPLGQSVLFLSLPVWALGLSQLC